MRHVSSSLLLLVPCLLVIGCGEPASSSTTQPSDSRVDALEKRVAKLEAELAALKSRNPDTGGGTLTAGGSPSAPDASKSSNDHPMTMPGAPVQASGAANAEVNIVANPALTGVMGRIVVKFPEGTKTKDVPVAIHPAGDTKKQNAHEYGNMTTDLLPGRYDVVISGATLANVEVRSKCDSQIPVGVLRVNAGKDTAVAILDAAGKKQLTQFYGPNDVGLPAGKYNILVSGQTAPVEVKTNEVTNF
jgi:hypothetical protein